MRNIVAVPVLGLAVLVQSAVVGEIPLLDGFADLVLVILIAWALQEGVTTAFQWAFLASVMVSLLSSLPWFVYVAGYSGAVLLAFVLQRRIWQVPMLAMLSLTFLGTVLLHLLSYLYLSLSGGSMPLGEALGLITLPTALLNLLIAIPLFGVMRDVAHWVYPSAEAA